MGNPSWQVAKIEERNAFVVGFWLTSLLIDKGWDTGIAESAWMGVHLEQDRMEIGLGEHVEKMCRASTIGRPGRDLLRNRGGIRYRNIP
jgi:hypothetical protein